MHGQQSIKVYTFKAPLMLGYALQCSLFSFTDIATIAIITVNFYIKYYMNKFSTQTNFKPTNTGLYIQWDSFCYDM